jgi:hypothetical protein
MKRRTSCLRSWRRPALLFAAVLSLTLFGASSAVAVPGAPQWTITAVSRPTNFHPGDESGDDAYVVDVTNTGGASSAAGEPIVVTDELPTGLALDPSGASGEDELVAAKGETGSKLTCLLDSCTYTGVVVPDDTLIVRFPVDVAPLAPSSVTNFVHVSGGGALAASRQTTTTISSAQAGFGISDGGASTALSSTQAGAHPDLTTAIAFNSVEGRSLAGDPKDTTDELPPGFVGDVADTPSCPAVEFLQSECPIATQIGVTTLTLTQTGTDKGPQIEPVYNLAPSPGEAAKIGFAYGGKLFYEGDVTVRPSDYGLETTFHNATEGSVELEEVSLTVWGVPAAAIHDPLRWKPGEKGNGAIGTFGVASEAAAAPFLTNSTVCSAVPLEATFDVNSWEQPAVFTTAAMPFGPLVGCDRLGMAPSLTAVATTDKAYAPTGFDLEMGIPQTYDNPEGLATSTLKREVVTLPEGMTVNPSAGAGLGACTQGEYEEEPVQAEQGRGCPSESKLGKVEITTPLLKEKVVGSVFLAQPYANPFGSLLALYVVARIPERGIIVRAAGEVSADETTGRLVTTFDDLPPLPFNQLTFSFNTSPLVTPATCNNYDVEAQLTPWSNPDGAPIAPLIPSFPITNDFNGGPCPSSGVPPFAPQVIAGTNNNDAGSYSPLYLRVIREDGEQEITGFSSQLPPGLTANLTGVPFCPEADIARARGKTGAQEEAEPSCPSSSEIGHTLAGAGVGPTLVYAPGKLYMGGPFEGAPFSIVSITSAKVGPFDLGTVVVHLPLLINPVTAAVTVGSGSADQIPHIIKGIVIHVRDIRVYVDRHDYTLNPTNCDRMTFGATVIGSGASFASSDDDDPVTTSDPFQTADCQSLAFKPRFQVSTSGRTSKADGASLHVKLTYPSAPLGTQANIHSVKVDLPIHLPSRLTTLQKACPDTTFDANPAACPVASRVGQAKAVTPVLPVSLVGPAYFVSHGNAKFPELIIVLQGYGVTIDLHGETYISKAGITSSTYRTVPDQPVTSFELTLPEGPYSALAAYGNLCEPKRIVKVRKKVLVRRNGHTRHVVRTKKEKKPTKLTMPTIFTAQNGAVIQQSTPIAVTGCHKRHKTKKKARRHKKAH